MIAHDQDLTALVLDALDAGVVVLSQDQRVVAWNQWMESASGISAEAARGRRLSEIFRGASLNRLNATVTNALEDGASSLLNHSLHPQLLPLKRPTGTELVHTVLVRPVGEKPGRRCLVQVRDVTTEASRERVLRERQKARYDAVVETAPDAILTLDAAGVVQLANPAAARQLGYAADELQGSRLGGLFQDQMAWAGIWRAVLAGENLTQPIELAVTRKDGGPTYAGVTAARWTSQSSVFVTVILRDVSARRSAENALRDLNASLEHRVAERTAERDRMWRLSNDLMLASDRDGRITAVNPAWSALLGIEQAEIEGTPLQSLVVEEDRPVLQAALKAVVGGEPPGRFSVRMADRDGQCSVVEWSAAYVDGFVQAVGRDVTAEREAAQALERAQEELRQSRKMEALGQLTGGIAHDFNNLLTGIIGSMDILKRRMAAGRYEDTERFMDAAVASANRAAALTHRLLAFARAQPLDPKPIDVNRLVRGMEELLRRSLGEKVELAIEPDQDVWPIRVDANQLENAVLNLAINARDAMPGGGELSIQTRNASVTDADATSEIGPGDYAVICVSDTGVGISPEVLSKVFDPFFTTKPIGKGTGLGLSMIYGFAKQTGGHVRIDSKVGSGTKVALYLPRYAGPVVFEEPGPARALPKGHGETVLVVEDDAAVRLLIGEVLRDFGYATIEAHDGAAAVPVLGSNVRLDLMITDVGLPGLDGRQLAELARRHRPGLKVLFVTAYVDRSDGFSEFMDGRMGLIRKPFALDALALKISDMIRL